MPVTIPTKESKESKHVYVVVGGTIGYRDPNHRSTILVKKGDTLKLTTDEALQYGRARVRLKSELDEEAARKEAVTQNRLPKGNRGIANPLPPAAVSPDPNKPAA